MCGGFSGRDVRRVLVYGRRRMFGAAGCGWYMVYGRRRMFGSVGCGQVRFRGGVWRV